MSDYIYGQEVLKDIKIGAFGNGKSHGCGPAAVYNAMIALTGSSEPIGEIVRFLKKAGGFNFGGLFGTRPSALVKYIRHSGFNCAGISYLPADVDKLIKESDAGILLYIWRRGAKIGAHYITIIHTDGQYLVYNEFNNDTAPRAYSTIKKTAVGLIRIRH